MQIKKMAHIFSWLLIIQEMIPAMLFGAFVAIPLALLFKIDMQEFPIWGNAEENPPEWFYRKAAKTWYIRYWPRWWWYSVRNPLNNLRFLFNDREDYITEGWPHGPMEAQDLIDLGLTSAYRWRERGLMAGYRVVWLEDDDKYSELWFGWKVGSIVPGLGFATSIRLKRDIGT